MIVLIGLLNMSMIIYVDGFMGDDVNNLYDWVFGFEFFNFISKGIGLILI